MGFCMAPKSRDFHEISSFLESRREASREILGWLASVLHRLRVSCDKFWKLKRVEKIGLTSMRFQVFDDFSWCYYASLLYS